MEREEGVSEGVGSEQWRELVWFEAGRGNVPFFDRNRVFLFTQKSKEIIREVVELLLANAAKLEQNEKADEVKKEMSS